MNDNCPVMFADLLKQGGISLDRLQSFCEVAEAGGVTLAAKGDPTKQSLFSRQVKELEEFFGIDLVKRRGRGIALTVAGEQLRAVAREQLSALSDFKRTCNGQAIELTVASGDSLIYWLLLPRLESIRAHTKNVTFRILNLPTAEIGKRLRNGTVDIGLIRQGSVTRPLKTKSLGAMTFSLFVPSQLLPATKPKLLSDKLPLATLEGAGQFRQELARLSNHHKKMKVNIQLELSSFPLVARAVQTGGFAGILPSIAAAELGDGGIKELKMDDLRSLEREVVLAWNPRTARIRTALEKAIPVFYKFCQL